MDVVNTLNQDLQPNELQTIMENNDLALSCLDNTFRSQVNLVCTLMQARFMTLFVYIMDFRSCHNNHVRKHKVCTLEGFNIMVLTWGLGKGRSPR